MLATSLPACAQVVAIVGGEPITEVDIQQRSRLIELSTQKKPPRQEVLDELIDDKLKVQLSKRYIAEVPKRDIETAFANMARRAGMTPAQFAKSTASQGVSAEALKARIHADFVWTQIIRGKFQGSLQVGDKEVEVKMQGANPQDPVNYEYKLRPVLFLLPARRRAHCARSAQEGCRGPACPLPELRGGLAFGYGASRRCGPRDDYAPVRRSRRSAAQGARTTRLSDA